MDNQLYIPTKLKVGFQKREGTYTGNLAYIVYIDNKGVTRKEKSFEGWRDQTIDVLECDNSPRSGFILNKDIQRWSWSYYSSGRSMVRIYDSRGF
jgi:hypothetical protein